MRKNKCKLSQKGLKVPKIFIVTECLPGSDTQVADKWAALPSQVN